MVAASLAETRARRRLGIAIAALTSKSGYARRFNSGADVVENSAVSGTSSRAGFVYAAEPVTTGQTGVRSFGGDSSGVICFNGTGAAVPSTTAGLTLGANCVILQ